MFNKIKTFIRESVEELKKVNWPTKDEAVHSAIVVVLFVVAFSLFLSLIDAGLSRLVGLLLKS